MPTVVLVQPAVWIAMLEMAGSSDKWICIWQGMRCQIPENSILHCHHRENRRLHADR